MNIVDDDPFANGIWLNRLFNLMRWSGVLLTATTFAADRGPLDMEAIRRIAPGAPIDLPREVMTPAFREMLMAEKDRKLQDGLLKRANEYLKTPAPAWRDRIPVRVGLGHMLKGLSGVTDQFNYTCPSCKNLARFGEVDLYGGKIKMLCCDTTFYEDPAQHPPNAPGKPNRTFKIMHWDGTEVEYPCYEFPDRFTTSKAWAPWSPTDGSPRHEIFIPGGTIRCVRLLEILNQVIPDLGLAYLYTGEEKYAVLLAELFDRLATLYPAWPLWMNYANYNFALNRAGDGLLTRAEYEATTRPMRWGTPFWSTYERSLGMGHVKTGTLMPQYDMQQVAGLVKAFACIRGAECVKKWSQARPGAADAFDRHVMANLFGEIAKLHKCYEPWLGNYTQAYFEGGILLSMLTGDRYFFDVVNELMERSLYDEAYADHMTTQGSCAYSDMVYCPLMQAFQMRKKLYDPEVERRHPRLKYLVPDGTRPKLRMASCRAIIPAFGDAWNSLYHRGLGDVKTDPASRLSTHCPDYGASMLRWGEADGRRQEICMVYQRISGHTHSDALNLEYFVDGVPFFFDMGYGDGTVNTDVQIYPGFKEIIDAGWPRPILDTGPFYRYSLGKATFCYLWFQAWNNRTLSHCTVMVDEKEPNPAWAAQGAGMPVTILADSPNPSRRLLEVLDVAERGLFPEGPKVSEYRRALLTVHTPSGGGYVLDVFRVTGGRLHEFIYHAISEKSESSLPPGSPQAGTLAHHRDSTRAQPERMKELDHPQMPQMWPWSKGYRFVKDLRRIDPEPAAWRLSWEYDPTSYSPKTAKMKEKFREFTARQKPLAMNIHAVRQRGSEQQASVWRARGLLTGHLNESLKDGSTLDGGWHSLVGFDGGLDMVIMERRGTEGLQSVFVHVLEGRRAALPAEVANVEAIPGVSVPEGGVALRVKLADGTTDLVFCLKDEGEVTGPELHFKGRYGLVRQGPDGKVRQACLARGTVLQVGEFETRAAAEYECQALRFEGDLTGDRSRPAIVVKSRKSLPKDAALAGQPVHVVSPDGWTDVYFIESVARAGWGKWRIQLRDHPTFIIDFLTVGDADEKDPYAFYPMQRDLTKASLGAIYGHNVTLARLSDGREYAVDLVHADPHSRERVVLRDRTVSFAECGLKKGDQAILYRHRPGDRVIVPLCKTVAVE